MNKHIKLCNLHLFELLFTNSKDLRKIRSDGFYEWIVIEKKDPCEIEECSFISGYEVWPKEEAAKE